MALYKVLEGQKILMNDKSLIEKAVIYLPNGADVYETGDRYTSLITESSINNCPVLEVLFKDGKAVKYSGLPFKILYKKTQVDTI